MQQEKKYILPADKVEFIKAEVTALKADNDIDHKSGDFDSFNHKQEGAYKAYERVLGWLIEHPSGCEWVKATDKLPGWGKYVKWRHESGKELPGQESVHSMTDRDHASLHSWEWYDESPSKEGNKEREGEFAEWLYQNRWFSFENGKWHYTFEQGTAVSEKTYQKNYIKSTAQLYEQYLQQKDTHMQHNTCKACGANNGRAGMLINDECLNCHETRKTGAITIHTNLERTEDEIKKTISIIEQQKG